MQSALSSPSYIVSVSVFSFHFAAIGREPILFLQLRVILMLQYLIPANNVLQEIAAIFIKSFLQQYCKCKYKK